MTLTPFICSVGTASGLDFLVLCYAAYKKDTKWTCKIIIIPLRLPHQNYTKLPAFTLGLYWPDSEGTAARSHLNLSCAPGQLLFFSFPAFIHTPTGRQGNVDWISLARSYGPGPRQAQSEAQ